VQVAICPTEEDSCLLRLVDGQSDRQRKSRSAVILSIIEHFEKGRRLGEIPIGFSVLLEADLAHALTLRKKTFATSSPGTCSSASTWSKRRRLPVHRRFGAESKTHQAEHPMEAGPPAKVGSKAEGGQGGHGGY
jgi:hypothetical protein